MQARTFTESKRRTQIVAAAIEVIAEVGYAKASFTRIARHAGLSSTGMISYHFADRDDLITACVAEIEQVMTAFMEPRIDAATGYVAQLRAYVEANIELVAQHAAPVRALIDIVSNAPGGESPATNARLALFEGHLRAGQEAGEFTTFDPHVTALALIGSIDSLVFADSSAGLGAAEITRHGRELAALYVRATASKEDDHG